MKNCSGRRQERSPVEVEKSCRSPQVPEGVQCLMALDGAEVTAAEGAALERACVIFDGNDEASVAAARAQWKALTAAGLAAQYWSEESGRWQKKAETAGRDPA